ncbi:predicted protein [Nematostella vectensis]|uniref:Uncharacterized protein n=1 Tax=Nematostella vectensis TaxID=45351 RepID=A7T3N6_NEMVE|nr:predicted protein [Nematostella vectensis]|eukprot:XP_001621530.1 hypothetical protein NEMVEDRAFT_v1g221885 [Nematostella vectensis]
MRLTVTGVRCNRECCAELYRDMLTGYDWTIVIGGTTLQTMSAETLQSEASKRYKEAKGSKAERLVSGSDDFTLFLWEPEAKTKPIARMTERAFTSSHCSEKALRGQRCENCKLKMESPSLQ